MENQFIKATEEACTFEHPVPAPYIRKSFVLPFRPERAVIDICGLGFYELYINGIKITKGMLAPYISNPDDYCYYDEYFVQDYLNDGENVIGVILGNGFFNPFGGAIWEFDKARWIGPPVLALEFQAENGKDQFRFCADESFQVHPSPIIFDELRMGEHYDASKEIADWNLPGADTSRWTSAMQAEAPLGEMAVCTAEPVMVLREIKPVSIQKCQKGYIYDFGENNAGVCRLSVKTDKKQKIELLHGEHLKDGELDLTGTIFERLGYEYYYEYSHRDVYFAKGSGLESYVPSFTYHGFRYVLVKGITEEQAVPELLTFLVMGSDIRTVGGFCCSDQTANTLFEMAERSDRSNFFYFPTDCPHREKNGWTGDASMSAAHMMLLYDADKSWIQWLRNIRRAQNEEGKLPGIVPTAGWGYEWGSGPGWDSVLFNVPYELYKYRGNTEVIKENTQAMVKYLRYIMAKRSEDGTIAVGLGDWVPVGKADPGQYDAPLALTDTVMVMDMARKAEVMFRATGNEADAGYAHNIGTELREVLRRTMIDPDTMLVKGACESSQAIALYYGLFDEAEKETAFARLLELIEAKDGFMDGGLFGLRSLFHVLSEFGHTELAYKMVTRKEFPSYGYLIETGETTLVEQFLTADMQCGSRNHHFMGDIARWFVENIAGLKIVNSKTVVIAPNPPESIDSASAYHDLPSGRVSVSWIRTDGKIKLDIKNESSARCIVMEE